MKPQRPLSALLRPLRRSSPWAAPLLASALAACSAPQAAGPGFASGPGSAAVADAPPRADAGRLAADVAWLADDAREGRRAGTAGEREAAEWIAARFGALGLEPAGADGWFQELDVPLPARDGGGSTVRAGGRSFGSADVRPLFCSARGEAEGPVAFAGYGVLDEDLGWDDFPGVDANGGGVALLVRGRPPFDAPGADDEGADDAGSEGEGWGNAGSIFTKVMNARRAGYAAALLVDAPGSEGPLLSFDAGRAARAPIPALHVTGAVADAVLPGWRDALARTNEEALAASDLALVAEPAEVVGDVRREEGTARNVLALLPGTVGNRTLVVGAHFDHLGRGGPGSLEPQASGEIHNGADDNASGTAVVLELARLLAADPPEADVLFALWSAEELGLLGSEHWAEHATVPLAEIAGGLNLDMVGRAESGGLQLLGAGSSPAFSVWLDEAGSRASLELDVAAGGTSLGGSDHMTFLKREIPTLHLFTGVHADYHRPSDDVERFEAEGARRVTELAEFLLERMSEAGELPFAEDVAAAGDEAAPRERGWSTWFGSVPAYGFDGPGVEFSGTSPGSPAEKAGFLAGDVLRGLGDVEIETIHDFVYALQVYKPGDVVVARYLRDGDMREVRMTLGTRAIE